MLQDCHCTRPALTRKHLLERRTLHMLGSFPRARPTTLLAAPLRCSVPCCCLPFLALGLAHARLGLLLLLLLLLLLPRAHPESAPTSPPHAHARQRLQPGRQQALLLWPQVARRQVAARRCHQACKPLPLERACQVCTLDCQWPQCRRAQPGCSVQPGQHEDGGGHEVHQVFRAGLGQLGQRCLKESGCPVDGEAHMQPAGQGRAGQGRAGQRGCDTNEGQGHDGISCVCTCACVCECLCLSVFLSVYVRACVLTRACLRVHIHRCARRWVVRTCVVCARSHPGVSCVMSN